MFPLAPKMLRVVQTTNAYLAAFGVGAFVAITGTTTLDLQNIVGVTTAESSFFYTGRAAGWFFGTLVAGVLSTYFPNRQAILCWSLLSSAVGVLAVPWCRTLTSLILTMAFSGLSIGVYIVGVNVWCLQLWGKDSSPYLQALYFSYAIGSFVSPLMAEPFLSPILSGDNTTTTVEFTYPNSSAEYLNVILPGDIQAEYAVSNPDSTILINTTLKDTTLPESIPSVTYAYLINGFYLLFSALSFLAVLLLTPSDQLQDQTVDEKQQPKQTSSRSFKIALVFLASAFIFLECGVELGYGQLVATFAVTGKLKLSKSMASFVTSAYWGAYTIARGFAIPLATKLRPLTMVIGNLAVMIVSSSVLCFFGNSSEMALWAGTCVLGAGVSSVFANLTLWLSEYITVGNLVSSVTIAAATCGMMVLPVCVSMFLARRPEFLLHAVLFCSVGSCVVFFFMWMTARRWGTTSRAKGAATVKA